MQGNCVANIKMYEHVDKLSEITQSMNLKYSFINKEMEQVHTPVICRDFLHDIVRANLINKSINIHGLSYNPKKHKHINTERLVMLLEFPKGFVPNVYLIQRFLQTMENGMDLTRGEYNTCVLNVSNLNIVSENKYIIVSSPGKWLTSPSLLSLYTLLIKVSQHSTHERVKNALRSSNESISNTCMNLIEEMKRIVGENYDKKCTDANFQMPTEINYLKSIVGKLGAFVKEYNGFVKLNKDGFDSLYYNDMSINDFHELGILGLLNGQTNCGASKIINERLKRENRSSSNLHITGSIYDLTGRLSIKGGRITVDLMSLALVKKEKTENGSERVIFTELENNGEALIRNLDRMIKNKKKDHPDFSKTRLLCSFDKVHQSHGISNKLAFAKKIINVIENNVMTKKEYKKDKMLMAKADIIFKEYGDLTSILFTGSEKWVRSPYLFFVLTSIIKTLGFASIDKHVMSRNIDTPTDIRKTLDEIIEKNTGRISGGTGQSIKKLGSISNNIDFIINNFDALNSEDYVNSYNAFTSKGVVSILETKNKEMSVGGNSK